MTIQDYYLKQEATKGAGAKPVYVDFNGGDWTVGFRSKLAAYTLLVEHFKCAPNYQVGFNKSHNFWYVSRVGVNHAA